MKRMLGIFALAAALFIAIAACTDISGEPEQSGSEDYSQNSESSDSTDTSSASDVSIPVSDSSTNDIITSDALLTEETTTVPPDPINNENGIVQTAEALIGIPFAENGASPSEGFDNSGFIYYVLRENGFINCPRFISDQAAMGTHIGYDQLKSGDLAFFSAGDGGSLDFGGIYIGEGQMIYSPMPGQTVKMTDITSDYWKNSFVTGVSLS